MKRVIQLTATLFGISNVHKRAKEHLGRQTSSVTRLGDLFDFGQLFKAFGKN